MAEKTIPQLQSLDEVQLSHIIPVDTGTQTFKAEVQKIFDLILATLPRPTRINPFVTVLASGSGTWLRKYAFVGSGIDATAGATYTNNGITYTVAETVADETVIYMTGSGAPTASGTLTKASGTGDATIAFTVAKIPDYIRVRAVGGGGGGRGGGAEDTIAVAGTDTTFGTLTAGGGGIGYPGIGGSATLQSGAKGVAIPGGAGHNGSNPADITDFQVLNGGGGGSSPFGGAGAGALQFGATAGRTNSGSGGGGGQQVGNSLIVGSGAGGGAGGYVDQVLNAPAASYAYAVGPGGAGGIGEAGTGTNGGAGGSGVIIVEEHFNQGWI